MKKIILILGLFLVLPAHASDGLLTMPSQHDVASTVDRLEQAVTKAGFKVFARINHGAAAASVDISLKPVELLIFGKPKVGSLLMQSNPSVAIDLPVKYLVWEDASGKVLIGWNDPKYLTERHGITDKNKVVGKMTGALKKFATSAAN